MWLAGENQEPGWIKGALIGWQREVEVLCMAAVYVVD